MCYSSFQINLHEKDLNLFKKIKSYFGVGNLHKCGSKMIQYHLQSAKDLKVILNHFDQYPLTQKQKDYFLFKMIINLINSKNILQWKGF